MLDNYSQLLIDVQKKANIVVSNISDIKFLKEEIEIETTNNIGFNTLRRLFGFMMYQHKKVEILKLLKSRFKNTFIMSMVILSALLFSFLGLKITNPLISGLFFLASPLTTILFSSLYFKETISLKNSLSITIISIGAYILYINTT